MLTMSRMFCARSSSNAIRSMLSRWILIRMSLSRTSVVTSAVDELLFNSCAVIDRSSIAAMNWAVGIRSTIRERITSPCLSV